MNNKLKYFIIPSLFILVATASLIFYLYQRELNFYKDIYNNEVAVTTSLVSRRLQNAFTTTESIRAFFSSSQLVTKEEFDSFASILTKNIVSDTSAIPLTVEWVDAQNNIQYLFQKSDENANVIKLNLNQYSNRLLSIADAKQSRSVAATEPIMLEEGYPGLILYSPLFKGDNFLGGAAVVVRLNSLLSPAAGSNPIYSKNGYVQTNNFIAPFDKDVIFNNSGERVVNLQGDLVKDSTAQQYITPKIGTESQDIIFANKTWHLKFFPTYLADVNKRIEIYSGIALFVILLIIVFLWILQKRREQLSKETAKTNALFTSIGDGLVACDENGILTYINQKAEKLFGYTAKESIGKSYFDIWRLVDKKGIDVPVKERPFYIAITKKEVTNVTTGSHLYILKNDGSRFPLASTITPIVVNNKAKGAIAVFRDITKESEVDRMKTEFLSLATHQLLAPCTAVKWTANLFLKGKFGILKKKQAEGIQDIATSNQSMINLVNSLLNVSRIESGRIIIDPKPTNLGDLVSEIEKELKNKIKDKNQSFSVKVEKGLPKISIDQNLIMEVYKNLVTNAIKYTPAKGKISVAISKVGSEIISKITDNGYGIPEKEKNKVFEKFYRGENITKIVKEGNGLGLYLVKQIIDVSGGTIGFESVVDKGTTFWFGLPLSGSKPKAGEVTIT